MWSVVKILNKVANFLYVCMQALLFFGSNRINVTTLQESSTYHVRWKQLTYPEMEKFCVWKYDPFKFTHNSFTRCLM